MSPDYTLRFRVIVDLPSKEEADNIAKTMGAGLSGFPTAKETFVEEPYEHRVPRRPPAPQRTDAADWLRRYLGGSDPVPARKVIEAADAQGISHRTLRRAADAVGVVRNPASGGSNTTWALP
jgi:hypothetical protein